jgi:hypothetical protein
MKKIIIIIWFLTFNFNYGQSSSSAILKGAEEQVKVQNLKEVIVSESLVPLQTKVGEYNQPLWSTIRMFPSTRIYVMNPPGTLMYEKWFDIRDRRDGPTQIRMRDEFTFGIGNRLQLDLYSHTVFDGENENHTFEWKGFSGEVRYALADWGKIFGNPTLYFEYKLKKGTKGIEPKILFGDNIGKRGIWGVNLIYEANIAALKENQEREYAYTMSYGTIVSKSLTVGASHMFRYNDFGGTTREFYVGPLVQYRFNNKAYISLEYLPGINQDAKKSRSMIIAAWRF